MHSEVDSMQPYNCLCCQQLLGWFMAFSGFSSFLYKYKILTVPHDTIQIFIDA